jgi:rubredoxin
MMESGEDIRIKRKIMAKMASGQTVPMGRYSPSCGSPTAAFNLVYESAFKEHFNCPRCDGKIPSGRGITTCPYCGAKKEDYGSACD